MGASRILPGIHAAGGEVMRGNGVLLTGAVPHEMMCRAAWEDRNTDSSPAGYLKKKGRKNGKEKKISKDSPVCHYGIGNRGRGIGKRPAAC